MAQLPTLTTARCVVEAFGEKYLSGRYVNWLNDPEVVRFSVQRHRRHDFESCRAYLASFAGTPHYFAAIVARDESLGHIGNINAYVDEKNESADIGILIGEKNAWSRGFGAEAWMAMSRFLLTERGLRKVTAGTLAVNDGMLGIMRRCGMREDGTRRRHYLWDGQEVDMIHMALFREDIEPS